MTCARLAILSTCIILSHHCYAGILGSGRGIDAALFSIVTSILCLVFILACLLRSRTPRAFFVIILVCCARNAYLVRKAWEDQDIDTLLSPNGIAIGLWILALLIAAFKWKESKSTTTFNEDSP